MTTSPLVTTRDALILTLPRTPDLMSDNGDYVKSDAEAAGQARMREAATRHSLNLIAASQDQAGDPEAWQTQALCAETDPEEFFPEKGGSTRAAKKICTGCNVRAQCLDYAMANDERFGIWGGLSERERRRLRRTSAT